MCGVLFHKWVFVHLSFGSGLISGRKPHTHTFLCEVRPDMLSVCDDGTMAGEDLEKSVIPINRLVVSLIEKQGFAFTGTAM